MSASRRVGLDALAVLRFFIFAGRGAAATAGFDLRAGRKRLVIFFAVRLIAALAVFSGWRSRVFSRRTVGTSALCSLHDQRAEAYVTRQIFSPPSSEMRSDPSRSTRRSTGRPQTERPLSSVIQPTTKSS